MPNTPSPIAVADEMSRVSRVLAALHAEDGVVDEQLLHDTIEGETGALELVDAIAEQALSDKALIAAAKERVQRLEARVDRTVALLGRILEHMGLRRLERPLVTLFFQRNPASVVIPDEKLIPDAYMRRSVDRAEVKKALLAGVQVPGASLNNQPDSLRLRGK